MIKREATSIGIGLMESRKIFLVKIGKDSMNFVSIPFHLTISIKEVCSDLHYYIKAQNVSYKICLSFIETTNSN